MGFNSAFEMLKFAKCVALFCELSQSEKAASFGQPSVLLQANVLATVSAKFPFYQIKMLDFSLRITHLIKIGFYSFPENPNFVFSKGPVDAHDNKT